MPNLQVYRYRKRQRGGLDMFSARYHASSLGRFMETGHFGWHPWIFCIRGDSNHMHRHVPDARCAESRYEIFRVFAMAGLRRRSICLWRDAWWGTCSLVPCSKCRVLCTFDIAWGLGYLSSSFQKSKFQIAIHDATDRRVSLNDPRRLLLSYIHSTTTFFFVL